MTHKLLTCSKQQAINLPSRLVYVEADKDGKVKVLTQNQHHAFDSDKAIKLSCEKQKGTLLTNENRNELERRLKGARNKEYRDIVRRFVTDVRVWQNTAEPNPEAISELQEQYLEELRILDNNSKTVLPWQNLIKRFCNKPKYDEARVAALKLRKVKGGDQLVAALADSQIEAPEKFVKYAELLSKGTAEQKRVILHELKKSDKTLTFRLDIQLNQLELQASTDTIAITIDGVKGTTKTVANKALDTTMSGSEKPISSYTQFRRGQAADASEKLQQSNVEYSSQQNTLRSFVEKELQVKLDVDAAGQDPQKKLESFFDANSVFLDGLHGLTPQQRLTALINNRVLDSSFYDDGEPDKIFNNRWEDLKKMASKYGVNLAMNQQQKDHILRQLKKMEVSKNECLTHLRVVRELMAEQKETANLQEASAREVWSYRTSTGLGEIPPLMDREGNYEEKVEADMPLLITEKGKTFKVKLSRLENEAQSKEGQEERADIKDQVDTKKLKGETYFCIEGTDSEGQKYARKLAYANFLEYVKVNNVRRDFTDEPNKIEKAQEILAAQSLNKAGIKIAPYSKFIYNFNRRQRDGSIKSEAKVVTITAVDAKRGTITLDSTVRLFNPSEFKESTADTDKFAQKRQKGSPMELGEFVSWVMRENVAEYFEEAPDEAAADKDTVLNQKLRENKQPEGVEPVQVGKEWSFVQTANTGQIYAVKRDPKNASGVLIADLKKASPKLYALSDTGKESMANNKTPWKITNIRNKHASSALSWLRDTDAFKLDNETLAEDSKEPVQDIFDGLKVVEDGGPMAVAALQKDYDNDIKPVAGAASPKDISNEQYAKVAEKVRGIMAENKEKDNGLAIPELSLVDPKQMSYTQVGFLRRMWMNTTVLTNNDIFEMGKAMYEYYQRRWQRNVKNRFSKVGKNIPWFGTEMDRINQNAETEEMNQFKEAMDNWGIWQIEDVLYATNNRDQAKACFITLAEKGKIRWENTKLWAAINKFTEPKLFIPIPKNGDPQMKDPRTGHTGIQLLPAAIDSLWGQGQYNDWYSQNASKYASTLKQYYEEGKQLEHDPYNNGSIDGQMKNLLNRHKEGEYVDPQQYEGLLQFCFEAGKSTFENKFYYVIAGVTVENPKGETILTWDRIGSLDGEHLGRLPWLDFLTNRGIKRADGSVGGWNKKDLRRWVEDWDTHNPGGQYTNSGEKNPALWKFLWQTVLNDTRTIVRTNKALRNAESMDHDDAHFIIPLAAERVIEDVLRGGAGGKKYFTYEGYANAFGGYAELIKNRAQCEPPKTNLVLTALKSFVRYESILSNRLYHDEKNRYARLDESYWHRRSWVSPIKTGTHRGQMQALVKAIGAAYNYDTTDIFTDLPEGEQYSNERRRIESRILNFSKEFEAMVKSDGGKAMNDVIQQFIAQGQIHGLEPANKEAADRVSEDEKEFTNEIMSGV